MKNQRRTFIKNGLLSAIGLMLTKHLSATTRHPGSTDPAIEKKTKNLIVKKIDHQGKLDIQTAEQLLEKHADAQEIATLNWASFPYKPDLKFKIAWCQDQILLKYYIREARILANVTNVNGDVCTDSCVEFFIATADNGSYYNFEFNCIGVPHVEYGIKGKRVSLDPKIIESIKVKSSLGNQPFDEKKGDYRWEMMIMIPTSSFCYDKTINLSGLKAKANFYKCGDRISVPHYVTWNPVKTKNPDFHQPLFFGELTFQK
jgi:hypothetical protein